MALILCIEAGTDVGSVALAKTANCFRCLRISKEDNAQNLAVYVQEVLQEHDLDAGDLDRCGGRQGAGVRIGLRIAVSLAKGICYGAGFADRREQPRGAGSRCSGRFRCGDSRRGRYAEHEAADDRRPPDGGVLPVVRCGGEALSSEVTAHIVTPESFLEQRTEKGGLLVFGNGAAKEPGAVYRAEPFAEVTPSARGLVNRLSRPLRAKFEDTAYFEPFI